ncbi:MAG: carbohydrate kinase family protein [Alkalispirochaeta sp.]
MIVHTGEALIDFIPTTTSDGSEAFRPSPGGSPYNSSIAAARLGVPAAFLGKLSRDFFGDQLLARLTDNGVDTKMVRRSDDPSTLAFVKKNEAGEARYAFFADGAADRNFAPEDVPALDDTVQAIVFGSISVIADPVGSTVLDLVERESTRRVVSFDPNIRDVLVSDGTDYRNRVARGIAASAVVKVSDEDLEWITGSADLEVGAAALRDQGPQLVVVTAGADGALAVSADGVVRVNAVPTTVSDTIGAGDSFHAALLSWLYRANRLSHAGIQSLNKDEVRTMLRFAAGVAARTCSRPGADPPWLAELDT